MKPTKIKLSLLALLFVMAFFGMSQAQKGQEWTKNGNNIYYMYNGGFVGVGTNVPERELDVVTRDYIRIQNLGGEAGIQFASKGYPAYISHGG